MSNQGCKDGYKTKILAYLKENTNSKNKASILKIRDAIYQEENGYDPLEKERENYRILLSSCLSKEDFKGLAEKILKLKRQL